MRHFSAVVFLALLASTGGPTFADAEKNATERPTPDLAAARELDRQFARALPRAAKWLLEHDDPRKRAAGLLYIVSQDGMLEAQAAMVERTTSDEQLREYDSIRQSALHALDRAETRSDDLPPLEPAELLDRFEKAIRTTTDGAALGWLAAACASADIETFCVEAGLDDAIVRHDGANLFSRLALFPGAGTETRNRLVIEAENAQNHVSQLTAVWFKALDEGPVAAALKNPNDKLVGAFVHSMAYGIPAYQPLTQACRGEITPDGELDRACGRIAARMISDSQTSIGQMVGFSVASSRAEARGDRATVALLEQRKFFEKTLHVCLSKALRDWLENLEASEVRDFIEMLDRHGELEAWARVAALHGIDCSDPDDPTAGAMEEYSRQLEGDS